MARILRGEIRWADLNPVKGKEQARLPACCDTESECFQ